jgi:AraC-like DNA-binding protein
MEKTTSKRKRPHKVHLGDLGIYIFESRHSPDFSMDFLARDFHQIYAVREGQGFVETENEKTSIHENQIFYAPAHTPHRLVDDPNDPLTVVVLCFYERVFGDCTAASESLSLFRRNVPALSPFKIGDNYTRVQIRNRFKALFVEQLQRWEGGNAVMLSQLIEFLVFGTRVYIEHQKLSPSDPSAAAFAGSLHYLEDNFFRPIRIEELASLANMSYRSYTEQFKRRIGVTVTQYLSERRVEYAKRLMLETDDILFAAVEAGFGDLTHFYRVFKKITGATPKQFIASQKPLVHKQAAA